MTFIESFDDPKVGLPPSSFLSILFPLSSFSSIFIYLSFLFVFSSQPIHVWSTTSTLGGGICTLTYVLAVDLHEAITLLPFHLGITAAQSFVYEYNGSSIVDAPAVNYFDANHPLVIPPAPLPGFNWPRYYRYFVIAPLMLNGSVLTLVASLLL
jgi:hypothetical protein